MMSTHSRPWLIAFLIDARPPSYTTINRFGTLVSYSGVRYGRSALTLGLAITMVMAPTGQASAQRPCPMHLCGLTITPLPPKLANPAPSGHTSVHVPQPMQLPVSMCGCCACGPLEAAKRNAESANVG